MKTEKKYTALQAATELKKSLHRAIAKADPALKAILSDLGDDNAEANVDKDSIPSAVPENVLYKAPQQPTIKAPSLSDNAPKIGSGPKNNVPANITQMAINQAPKAPSAPKKMSLSLPKSESMAKEEEHQRVKGVNTSGGFSGLEEKGQSQAGRLIERSREPQSNKYLGPMYRERGKDMHQKTLSDLKSMPKPNLPKSEEGMAKSHSNLNGMGKLKQFLDKRAQKANPDLKQDAALGEKVEQAVEQHEEQVPAHVQKPELAKSEYSPREAAIEVLKKAESILKAKKEEWDTQEVKKNTMVDPALTEERQVVNENDINNEARQQEVDTSKKRLNEYLAKRKAKKVKEQ